MSGIGTAVMLSRPTKQNTAAPRPATPPRPAPVAPPVTLVSMFDRNGDGKIDNTTWVDGGDAFVSVGPAVAQILDHVSAGETPAPAPTADPSGGIATVQAAEVVYRRYGGSATA